MIYSFISLFVVNLYTNVLNGLFLASYLTQSRKNEENIDADKTNI